MSCQKIILMLTVRIFCFQIYMILCTCHVKGAYFDIVFDREISDFKCSLTALFTVSSKNLILRNIFLQSDRSMERILHPTYYICPPQTDRNRKLGSEGSL